MNIDVPNFIFKLKEGEEIFSPKVDFAFKKLFGSEENKNLLVDFLQSVLDIPSEEYDEVEFKNTALLKDYDKDKYGILDVLIKTKHGTIIHVEIQVGDVSHFRERALYYLSRLITSQMETGKYYSTISKTISILVLNYELIHDSMEYKNVYHFYDSKTGSLFSDKLEIVTLELPKVPNNEAVDSKHHRLLSWLQFLKVEKKMEAVDVVEKYPHLQRAYEKIQELSRNPEHAQEYTERLIWYFDEIGRLTAVDRAIEDGLAQGMEKGLKQGIEKGIEQGIAQGIEQGVQKKAYEVAKKLLSTKMELAEISNITGLSEKEVCSLSNVH